MRNPGCRSLVGSLGAAVPLVILMMLGCGNPFTEFYSGRSLTDLGDAKSKIEAPAADPFVTQTDDVGRDVQQKVYEGWLVLGRSSWIGADVGTAQQAREQARKVGASLVIWSYRYQGSNTTNMPITTPTTSTTYGSGTVYGAYGSATWSGSATTYGTETTYVPITIHRYGVQAAFLCRKIPPADFGARVRKPSADDQLKSLTTEGIFVFEVIAGSPAAAIGLTSGDVIVRVGFTQMTDERVWTATLEGEAGRTVEIEWIHEGIRRKQEMQLPK